MTDLPVELPPGGHRMRRAEDHEELVVRSRRHAWAEAPREGERRADDPIRRMAATAAWDAMADRHARISYDEVQTICRIYHLHLRALGGRV